ncbi:MAG: hypothetical protein HY825_20275 [Acidobacteria bacterium]|nr:hypothetical protein [Acidobacteriota bacterium]
MGVGAGGAQVAGVQVDVPKSRSLAAAFQEELILFRRTLMSVAGRSDKDYQKLRAEKATATDDEDDPNAPPVPAPVEPGPPPAVVRRD